MESGPSNGNHGNGWHYWAAQIRDKKYHLIVSLALLVVFLGGAWYGFHKGGQSAGPGSRRILYYVDPMNPTHTSPEPGIAPCGMKMEPVYADGEAGEMPPPSLPAGSVKITPQKQQLIGVRLGVVEKSPFRYTLRALGRVAIDETRIYRLKSFVPGWIQEVSDAAADSLVMKDAQLASVRSPDILPTVQLYLESLTRANFYRGSNRGSQVVSQVYKNEILLKNTGMTDAQVRELTESRMVTQDIQLRAPVTSFVLERKASLGERVSPGEVLYKLADLSHVWIVADLFENEAPFVKPGVKVRAILPHQNQTFWATVTEIFPNFDKASQALKVRLETDNPGYTLRPDMFVDLEFPVDLPETVSLPVDAVMDTGLKKTVFVDRGNGYFEPRKVTTGWTLGDRVEITQGLEPGEKVIVSGNFLVDSESRMKLASAGMFGEVVRDPVIGVNVDASKARAAGHLSRYKNQTYYFHSEETKHQFEQNPERYLTKGVRSQVAGAASEEKLAPVAAKCPVCSVEVDENEARDKGLTSEYHGKTYFFCRYDCNRQFDKDPKRFVKAEAGCCAHGDQEAKEEPLIVKDPVCGLEVNRDQAVTQRLKREYQGRNYYFCRDYCAQEFDRDPKRYLAKGGQAHPAMDQATSETTVDPVCGMTIMSPSQSAYKSIYKGKLYAFCSYSCKEVFDLESERFLKKGAAAYLSAPATPAGQQAPPPDPGPDGILPIAPMAPMPHPAPGAPAKAPGMTGSAATPMAPAGQGPAAVHPPGCPEAPGQPGAHGSQPAAPMAPGAPPQATPGMTEPPKAPMAPPGQVPAPAQPVPPVRPGAQAVPAGPPAVPATPPTPPGAQMAPPPTMAAPPARPGAQVTPPMAPMAKPAPAASLKAPAGDDHRGAPGSPGAGGPGSFRRDAPGESVGHLSVVHHMHHPDRTRSPKTRV